MWLLVLVLAPALAQDPDDDLDDDIDIEESPEPVPGKPAPKAEPDDPAPAPDADDPDDGLDDFRDPDDDGDLLQEENNPGVSGDTETIYRATQAKLSKYEPDEELAGWEAYLSKYPASAYRPRIEDRMEELTDKMYEGPGGPAGPTDALRSELGFAQGLQIENIDPRTRLQVGFEMGLPNYLNLAADYEHQIVRKLSAHGSLRRRYTGYSLEAGVRWAPVKSVRTHTLVTLIGDLRLNTIPAFPAFRPQLALGRRFGKVDAQIQAGPELSYRTWSDEFENPDSGIQLSLVGGANVLVRATDQVGVFVETGTFMKSVPEDGAFVGGLFRFNVVSFGMKFYPGKHGDQEVNLGATLPYMQQWWQFHYGSIMGQYNYYPNSG